MTLTASERDLIWFYAGFALIAVPVLFVPLGSLGLRVWLLVAGWNIALLLAARWRGHDRWLGIWLFLLPLSILQVFPDWFLSAQLNVLVFPDIGAPMVGTVSSFMALMWVIPLFLAVMAGEAARQRHGTSAGVAAAAVTALLIFAASESISWRIPLWYAQDVGTWQHMAFYVLPAELVLGTSTYAGYLLTRERGPVLRIAAAAGIMLMYLGALAFFYLLFETL